MLFIGNANAYCKNHNVMMEMWYICDVSSSTGDIMDNCVIRSSVSDETRAIYGIEPGVVYKAEDGEHEKEGTLIVHLTSPSGDTIEIPVNLVVFLPAFSKRSLY